MEEKNDDLISPYAQDILVNEGNTTKDDKIDLIVVKKSMEEMREVIKKEIIKKEKANAAKKRGEDERKKAQEALKENTKVGAKFLKLVDEHVPVLQYITVYPHPHKAKKFVKSGVSGVIDNVMKFKVYDDKFDEKDTKSFRSSGLDFLNKNALDFAKAFKMVDKKEKAFYMHAGRLRKLRHGASSQTSSPSRHVDFSQDKDQLTLLNAVDYVSKANLTKNVTPVFKLSHGASSRSSAPSPIDFSQVDVNSTLVLLGVLTRLKTGAKYIPNAAGRPIPDAEVRAAALNVSDAFDQLVSELSIALKVPSSNFDAFQLFRKLEGLIRAGKLAEIEPLLLATAQSAFPDEARDAHFQSLLKAGVGQMVGLLLGKGKGEGISGGKSTGRSEVGSISGTAEVAGALRRESQATIARGWEKLN